MKDIVTISIATAANLNMKKDLYLSRRDFLNAAGVIAGSMALATCGQLPNTEPTPEPTTQPEKAEKVSPFGMYLIGEAKIGEIKSLKKQTVPNKETVAEIQRRVEAYVPEAKGNEVRVQMYDMVGTEGVLPFTIASIHDKKGQIMFAYTAFKVDEQGVQRAPIDGNIDIIYPLRDVMQENGSHYIGIPDQNNRKIDLPMLFYISKDGKEVYFTPPFTDYIPTFNPNGGIKVEAMPIALESPEPALPAEVQEKFDKNDTYSLNSDGQIEKTIDGVTSVVEEIKFNAEGKMIFTTQEGQEILVDTAMLKVVDQRIIFRDNTAEPKTWMYDGEKLIERKYTPPADAGWVTYEESLPDVNFVLNEGQANEKAIYENFLGLLPNSLKKTPWNEAITKIVQEKYGLEIVANQTPDVEKRIAFIKAFLEESGGIYDIYNSLNKTTLEGVDMNLPIVHKSISVSTLPEGFFVVSKSYEKFIAGNIVTTKNGQIEIILAHSPDSLKALYEFYSKNGWSISVVESLHFHMILLDFGLGMYKNPFEKMVPLSNPMVYLLSGYKLNGAGQPEVIAYNQITTGFLKNK